MPTVRKRSKARSSEPLVRCGAIDAWDLNVFAMAEGGVARKRSRLGRIHLTMRGKFAEPLNGVSDFHIQISGVPDIPAEDADLRAVGYVISVKPQIQAVIDLTEGEFRALMVMADAGRLATCRICFDKPHYGSAPIRSVSFSTTTDLDAL